jgi:hypothetical protein
VRHLIDVKSNASHCPATDMKGDVNIFGKYCDYFFLFVTHSCKGFIEIISSLY